MIPGQASIVYPLTEMLTLAVRNTPGGCDIMSLNNSPCYLSKQNTTTNNKL